MFKGKPLPWSVAARIMVLIAVVPWTLVALALMVFLEDPEPRSGSVDPTSFECGAPAKQFRRAEVRWYCSGDHDKLP